MGNIFEQLSMGFLVGCVSVAIMLGLTYLLFRPIFLWYWKINKSIINQNRIIYILAKLHKQMAGNLSDKEYEYLFYNDDISFEELVNDLDKKSKDNEM